MRILPPQYHCLVWAFREGSELLWFWLPTLIALYPFYCYLDYRLSRRITSLHVEGKGCTDRKNENTTDLCIDVPAQALQIPNHSVRQTVATQIEDIAQIHAHTAPMDEAVAQVTKVKGELSKAGERHVTNEETMARLENRMHNMESLFQGQLPTSLCKTIANFVSLTTRAAIERVNQEMLNKVALSTTNSDKDLMLELQDQAKDHGAALVSLFGLRAEVQRLRTETKQHIDRLESTVSQQAETIVTLTSTIHTLTIANTATQEHLCRLQTVVDNQATQLQSLSKISANVNELEAKFKTFTEPNGQSKAIISTLSVIQDKLREHDTELESARTNIDMLFTTNEDFENRIGKIEDDGTGVSSTHSTTSDLEVKTGNIETALAELTNKSDQFGMLDDRLKVLEAVPPPPSTLRKQLKNLGSGIDDLAARMDNCENGVTELRMNIHRSEDAIDDIKRTVKESEDTANDIQNKVKQLEDNQVEDMKFMRELNGDLKKVDEKVDNESKDVDTLFDRVEKCEGDIEALWSDDSSAPVVEANNSEATVAVANEAPPEDLQEPSSTPDTSAQESANASTTAASGSLEHTGVAEGFQAPPSGTIELLRTTSAAEAPSRDEEMGNVDPDPANPPLMDDEFDEEMLAGTERSESGSDDDVEMGSDVDAEGAIDDEYFPVGAEQRSPKGERLGAGGEDEECKSLQHEVRCFT